MALDKIDTDGIVIEEKSVTFSSSSPRSKSFGGDISSTEIVDSGRPIIYPDLSDPQVNNQTRFLDPADGDVYVVAPPLLPTTFRDDPIVYPSVAVGGVEITDPNTSIN